MIGMKYFKPAVVLSLFLFSFGLSAFSADDDLWLEGTSYEPNNPKASVAVINGAFLKVGDKFQNYQVVEIASNWVRVSNIETGKEKELYVRGAAPPPSAEISAKGGSSGGTAETKGAQTAPPSVSFNPFAFIQMANEVAVIADLKQIHMAGSAFFAEYELSEEVTVEKLVEREMISPIYKGGVKGGYKFSVKAGRRGIIANADPVDEGSKLKHFCIDDYGILHEEVGKPATPQSPAHEPGLNLPVHPAPAAQDN